MALREIRQDGDPVLRKKARAVEDFNARLHTLLDDMAETMYEADGVGLAAPQIGVRKRVAVVDVGEELLELINPEIIETEGSQCDMEGCLSLPGQSAYVRRPARIKVRAQNRNGETFEIEGTALLAVAMNHEIDHLDGILFTDKEVEPTEEELAILEARNAALREAMAAAEAAENDGAVEAPGESASEENEGNAE